MTLDEYKNKVKIGKFPSGNIVAYLNEGSFWQTCGGGDSEQEAIETSYKHYLEIK